MTENLFYANIISRLLGKDKPAMKTWIRKSLVVLFTIATFGMISPPPALMSDKQAEFSGPKQESRTGLYEESLSFPEETFYSERSGVEIYTSSLLDAAENQSFIKFGSKIAPVIEENYRAVIVPKIEEQIMRVVEDQKDHKLYSLAITDDPAPGRKEKIFNVYDTETGKDILKFHVRLDQPPKEGYWFNFHYHSAEDSFQTHYELGRIYWDRNTPPKWMTH
jgi:hypothetical protein